MISPFFAGLTLGLSLIVAIGAQNLFVLRQGIRRQYVFAVAAVCAVSDAILIAVGVSGLGLLLHHAPWAISVARWAGAAFLLGYAFVAARRAIRPTGAALEAGDAAAGGDSDSTASGGSGRGTTVRSRTAGPLTAVIMTCLALTWLNPHVYLDTVFLLGSVAATQGDMRWVFAAGAMLASVLWFGALAFGARYLSRWLASPRAWRILDGLIAVVMAVIAVNLIIAG
ncbi:LysE/ArgO family amino acid transporter [Microbacterium sp. NPDC089189]|uniref:LysE/ArgO family amino acid transporter n=1 Tax=Microbacterium sp. NPDC089189 TaxID=3154972 RepID=UPI00342E0CB8